MLQLTQPPHDFTLVVADDLRYSLFAQGQRRKFIAPSSTRGVAKLYTIAAGGALLYVGVAQQPMSARLSLGFRAKGKGGYHGYKWKSLRQALQLSVWTAATPNGVADIRALETVEAEVAFLCRQQSGQWPLYQHEIHFYASEPAHRAAATTIYAHAVRAVA